MSTARPTAEMSDTLAGVTVLVTRPQGQQAGLVAAIEAAGGRALHFPAMAISPYRQTEAVLRLQHATAYDWLVFISRNAVQFALPHLPARLPKLIAIGRATAASLQAAGLSVAVVPARFDSESVLASLPLHMQGQRILIVRGTGGREALAEGLQQRGATVEYAEVYRRHCPNVPPDALAQVLAQSPDIVTATSGEVLHNLLHLAGPARPQLLALPLVVMSERGAGYAKSLGFPHGAVYIAPQASDAGIVSAIKQWHEESSA
jgi:uroporphyrinogen-III synthase